MGCELKSTHRLPNGARAVATKRMPDAGVGAATSKMTATARAIDQPASLPGITVDLKQREQAFERDVN